MPEGKVAVANGRLRLGHRGRWTTWFWDAPDPQASYLTTASVGDYDLRFSETAGGLPIIDAVDDNLTPANAAATEASLELQAEMIAFLEETFVPYPFNSAGAIVDDDTVGYALETQTSPYTRGWHGEHRRPRARAPVVRQRREPGAVGGHLAQRGLGHLRPVAVERGQGRRLGPGELRRRDGDTS